MRVRARLTGPGRRPPPLQPAPPPARAPPPPPLRIPRPPSRHRPLPHPQPRRRASAPETPSLPSWSSPLPLSRRRTTHWSAAMAFPQPRANTPRLRLRALPSRTTQRSSALLPGAKTWPAPNNTAARRPPQSPGLWTILPSMPGSRAPTAAKSVHGTQPRTS